MRKRISCRFNTKMELDYKWTRVKVLHWPVKMSSNTGNIFVQLVAQHRCIASWKVLLLLFPPSLPTCHTTNFNVASCGNILSRKVGLSSTFCNKLSILCFAPQLAMLHNTCDWSIFRHQKCGKDGEEARAWPRANFGQKLNGPLGRVKFTGTLHFLQIKWEKSFDY